MTKMPTGKKKTETKKQASAKAEPKKHAKAASKPKRGSYQPERNFFMRIEHPVSFRRDLLEASKTTLHILKGLYGLRDVRHEKQQLLQILHQEVRDIRLLLHKAEEMLPKYTKKESQRHFPQMRVNLKQRAAGKSEMMYAVPEAPDEPTELVEDNDAPRTELDRINKSLSKLESKMKKVRHGKPRPVAMKAPPPPQKLKKVPRPHIHESDDSVHFDFPKRRDAPTKHFEHEETGRPISITDAEHAKEVETRPNLTKDINDTLEAISRKLKDL